MKIGRRQAARDVSGRPARLPSKHFFGRATEAECRCGEQQSG